MGGQRQIDQRPSSRTFPDLVCLFSPGVFVHVGGVTMFLFSSYFREDLPCGMKLNCAHFPVRYRRRFFESRGKGVSAWQPARSWRASGEGQISLSASAERAFANFRDKKHRILQLQIFRTKNVFFETKNVFFLQLHENGHFHGATFISDDLSVHYDSYILAHTVIGP